MKRYVCLRDDDTNYHTRPEDLINAYGEFWGKVPITLATVPFSHGSQQKVIEFQDYGKERDTKHREWVKNATAEELTNYHKVWPIGANKDLVEMLRPLVASGMIEIALHGVHHAYNERGPEMYSNETGFEAIRDGKEYLEKVFSTDIVTFIPPSNTIDVTSVGYIKRLNMRLFSSGTIVKDNSNIKTHDFHSVLVSLERRLLREPPKPLKKNFGIMQFSSLTFDPFKDYDSVCQVITNSLDETGFAGLGTHYTCFVRPGYKERYHKLLHFLQDEMDVTFVTAKDYYNLMMEKYYA